jgi:hypothetical protein
MAGLAATGSAALAAAAGGGRQRASGRTTASKLPWTLGIRGSRAGVSERVEAAPGALPVRVAGRARGGRGEERDDSYAEERYTHADGTTTIIREYQADGSSHIMSGRVEI